MSCAGEFSSNDMFSCPSKPEADCLHRFATHARRFMDAYSKGLKGKGATWAAKRYRGHRVLPESILREFDDAEKAGSA